MVKDAKLPGLVPKAAGAYAAAVNEDRKPPSYLPNHTEEYKKEWLKGYDEEIKLRDKNER